MALKLIIGNKNYSSWSLRPWIAMKAARIPFEEILVPLDTPRFKAEVGAYTSAGRVPVLLDGPATVWESLAIIEHLAERFPDRAIWPADPAARGLARSIAAEMHCGFAALRRAAPMNLWRPVEPLAIPPDAQADVDHIAASWRRAREQFGKGGDFLFGEFGGADAMYAPVATRIRTYDLKVDAVAAAYVDAIHEHPAFKAWKAAALLETDTLAADEVDWPVVKRV